MKEQFFLSGIVAFLQLFYPSATALDFSGSYNTEKEIVIIVPSYCNSEWYKKNLDSILNQDYSNFRIIYIDDASEDNTAGLVKEYVKGHTNQDKFFLIEREKNVGAMANRYSAIHTYCQGHEIIVECDGDDWYLDNQVLKTINEAYQDPNVWLTYGQLTSYPDDRYGVTHELPKQIILERNYREMPNCPSMLRTYYAWLFKEVKLKDLLYNSCWVSRVTDWSYMFPMLEMADGRIKYLDRVVYVVNRANRLNMSKIRPKPNEGDIWSIIRDKPLYLPIKKRTNKEIKENINIIIRLSKNPLARLKHFLISAHQFLKGHNPLFIAIDENNITSQLTTAEQNLFEDIQVITNQDEQFSFGELLLEALELCSSKYIVMASDLVRFFKHIDLRECAQSLEDTSAYAFFLGLTPEKINPLERIPLINIEKGIHAWQFSFNEGKWGKIINFDATMYQADELKRLFICENYQNVHTFNKSWKQHFAYGKKINLHHVGLCFEKQCTRV